MATGPSKSKRRRRNGKTASLASALSARRRGDELARARWRRPAWRPGRSASPCRYGRPGTNRRAGRSATTSVAPSVGAARALDGQRREGRALRAHRRGDPGQRPRRGRRGPARSPARRRSAPCRRRPRARWWCRPGRRRPRAAAPTRSRVIHRRSQWMSGAAAGRPARRHRGPEAGSVSAGATSWAAALSPGAGAADPATALAAAASAGPDTDTGPSVLHPVAQGLARDASARWRRA